MIALMIFWFSVFARAEVEKVQIRCEEPAYCVEAELNPAGASLYLVTKNIGPMVFGVDGSPEFKPSKEFPIVVNGERNSRVYLGTLAGYKKENLNQLKFMYIWGRLNAELKDDVFLLPYDGKNSYLILQGYNSRPTHNGDIAWAVDFGMTEGTDVLAARDGTVVYVKDDYNQTAVAPEDYDETNCVIILHEGGIATFYNHLRYKSAVVKMGDQVNEGQKIAQSGMTGRAKVPHLHFHVFHPVNFKKKTGKSLKVRFKLPGGRILPDPEKSSPYPP